MGKTNQIKKENYAYLFERMKIAHINQFYFEQIWIAYSIIEDRLVSLLDKSGGTRYKNGKEIKMLGPKIVELEKRNKKNIELRKVLYGDMLEKLKKWGKRRNSLMHALASEKNRIELLFDEIKDVAIIGDDISREISTRARRFKKIISK